MIIVQVRPSFGGVTSGGTVSFYIMVTMVVPLFGGTASSTIIVEAIYIVSTKEISIV